MYGFFNMCVMMFAIASCDIGKQWFANKGRYEKFKAYGGTYVPKTGDIVFYSSTGTQKDATHVGYIVEVLKGKLTAIEGNKGNAVAYRTLTLTNTYIIGYGRVADFLDGGSTSSGSTDSTVVTKLVTVSDFQKWLNDNFTDQIKACDKCGNKELTIDNKYGQHTQAAAVVAFQVTANKTFGCKLKVDGDFGSSSKAYGNKALVNLGSSGDFVKILEGVLCGLGYYAGEFDGKADEILVSGIKAYQAKNGLTEDGENGAISYYKEFHEKD